MSAGWISAQPVAGGDTAANFQNNSLNVSSQKILKSYSSNKSDDEIAEDYFGLGMELMKNEDYKKAEIYILKAIKLVKRQKKNPRLSVYYRELARVQELLNKYDDAADNYDMASSLSGVVEQRQINSNDANRMRSVTSPDKGMQYLDQNAQILNTGNDSRERAFYFSQKAEVNRALNQPDQAMENYKNALSEVNNKGNEAILIKNNMANLMAENNNYEGAISIQKEVVEQSQQLAGVAVQTKQMRNLSDLYFKTDKALEGLKILQDAYRLAVEKGSVKEAKASLDSLIQYYDRTKQKEQVLLLYRDFVNNLEGLIAKDSSLIDIKLFQLSEEKISQLEKEKTLKDELISRKNMYNMLLVFSVLLLVFMILLVAKAWFSINIRNKQIALQSLRREMNPHFIFNSLNSVNQFIAGNNEREANKYLTSYSDLMRKMMENSNKDYISLHVEADQLKKYLELERMRFPDKFDYLLKIDELLDMEAVKVPNMLIQPHVENAIWHGLRYKETKGLLTIKFESRGRRTAVIIEDNGIGLTESALIKTKNQKLHESRGLKNVQERIRLLNKIYKTDIRFVISEKKGAESGVVVEIEW